jgi:Carbamoyl-phosphate synthase L chain, ATP binding domain
MQAPSPPRQPRAAPRRRRITSPTLYLVSPASLRSWFHHFTEQVRGDRVVFLDETRVDLGELRATLKAERFGTVVVHSSHDTLERDACLSEWLTDLGRWRVVGPSALACALGSDKFLMKEFFDEHGFVSPAWRRGGPGATVPCDAGVIKHRHGTQSDGTRLRGGADERLAEHEFCEVYLEGVEYSVVVYRDELREVVFPPIWKGATQADLTPPWLRLRRCPDAGLAPERDRRLRESARAIARAADIRGLAEIEYVVSPAGEAWVLEINPRVAGTMRLAAMATRAPIFSLHRSPHAPDDLQAVRCVAEMPYSGSPFSDPENEVFASSRVTAAAPTFAGAMRKLEGARVADESAAPMLAS